MSGPVAVESGKQPGMKLSGGLPSLGKRMVRKGDIEGFTPGEAGHQGVCPQLRRPGERKLVEGGEI